MTKNNVLKEIDIENCKFYYFDDIININDLELERVIHWMKYHTELL